MGRAADMLRGGNRAKDKLEVNDEVGGLHGKVSTVDMKKLRTEYNDYVIEYAGSNSERLTFSEWVAQRR